MKKKFSAIIAGIGDAAIVNAGILLAFFVRFGGRIPERNFASYSSFWTFVTLLYLGVFYIFGLYHSHRSYTKVNILDNAMKAMVFGTLLMFVALYTVRMQVGSFPSSVIFLSFPLIFLMLVSWRFLLLRMRGMTRKKILLVGTSGEIASLTRTLAAGASREYELAGIVVTAGEKKDWEKKIRIYSSVRDIRRAIIETGCDEVIFAIPPEEHRKLPDIIARCQGLEVKFKIVPALYEIFLSATEGEEIDGLPIVDVVAAPIYGFTEVAKRIIDVVIAGVGLLVLSPFILIISILIRCDSSGRAFYEQERVGKNGKIFMQYKFRTMVRDAEVSSGPVLAKKNDFRITRVGAILRPFRLDEIPQLWNVLRGDMSLVGPRPERPYFVEKLKKEIPVYVERLQVRPGITGLAQVQSGYDILPKSKLRYDLLYVRKHSIMLDMEIILRTFIVILKKKGH